MTGRSFHPRAETPPPVTLPASLERLRNAVDRLEAATLYFSTHDTSGLDRAALAREVGDCLTMLDHLLSGQLGEIRP